MSRTVIPDLIEPVLAWRAWEVVDGFLCSPQQQVAWPTSDPLEAVCNLPPKVKTNFFWQLGSPQDPYAWPPTPPEGFVEYDWYSHQPHNQTAARFLWQATKSVYPAGYSVPLPTTHGQSATSFSYTFHTHSAGTHTHFPAATQPTSGTLFINPQNNAIWMAWTPPAIELPTEPAPDGSAWVLRWEAEEDKQHEAPQSGCGCGIYGVNELKQMLMPSGGWETAAIGKVALWGRTVRATGGYRAQYGFPSELWTSSQWVDALSENYKVPVRSDKIWDGTSWLPAAALDAFSRNAPKKHWPRRLWRLR